MDMRILKKLALLSASLVVVSGGAIAVNVPAIARDFPEIPLPLVESLTTMPSLFLIVSVLLSHAIARKVGNKRTVLVGQLLKIDWQTSFWVYLAALPAMLLFAALVPDIPAEPAAVSGQPQQTDSLNIRKKAMDREVFGYLALLVVAVMFYMTITVRVTPLMLANGYGDATDGSNILSLIGIGAMTAVFLFGKVFGTIGRGLGDRLGCCVLRILLTYFHPVSIQQSQQLGVGERGHRHFTAAGRSELLTTKVASFLRTPSLPAYVFADSGNGYG